MGIELTGKYRSVGVFGICLGIFIVALDWSIVNTALPTIQRQFYASITNLQWVMNIFAIFVSALLVTVGRIADHFGRRKLFFVGIVIFGFSSFFGGLAQNLTWLIVCRAFQGISTAILIPTTQGLVIHEFPDEQKGRALGIWTSVVGVGLAFGPVAGGVIISLLSWRWIFYINLPIAMICAVLVALYVSESKNSDKNTKIDWSGAGLLCLGVALIVTSLIEGPNWGWGSSSFLFLFFIGLVTLALFVWHELRVKYPIIEMDLFLNRMFFAASITNFVLIFFVWSVFFLLPLYLHNIYHFAPLYVGLVLLCVTVPVAAISPVSGKFFDKIGGAPFIYAGFFFLLLSVVLLSFYSLDTPLWLLLLAPICMGIGWGLMWGSSTTVGLSSLPKKISALASGALATMQEIGSAIGLGIAGSFFRMRDQRFLFDRLPSDHFSSTQITELKSQLADPEAFRAMSHSFGSKSSEIYNLMRTSFVVGFSETMQLLIAVMLVSLLIVLFFLRSGKVTKKLPSAPKKEQ